MAEVIRMPRMSDTMEEGVIVGWLKQVGDVIEPGDVLAEVETDKATMELESYQEGVLLYIGVKEGAVPVNAVLAVIGEEGEDYKAALAAADNQGTPVTSTTEEKASSNNDTSVTIEQNTSKASEDSRVKASPLAKRIAEESGIDLNSITGSGDNGRIIKKDVEALINQPTPVQNLPSPVTSSKPTTVPNADFPYEDVPVSQMRKVIARRLGESKFSAPHFYLTVEIEMSKAMATRKQLNEVAPVKISFNDLVVKACAVALRQHPSINSSWLEDRIRINKAINIGVAVAIEDGLLVPVIKNADSKSLSNINTEVRDLAGKAKEKRLTPDQMQGNTFTISNLGMFGIDEFTAIINPPDACILAVGSIVQKPIVKDGELAVGNIMKVTLSCDHRIVDGVTGAKFLQTVKSMLEDPILLLV